MSLYSPGDYEDKKGWGCFFVAITYAVLVVTGFSLAVLGCQRRADQPGVIESDQ